MLGYLLVIFAYTFNREKIVFPILLCGLLGYFRYNEMLVANNYLPIQDKYITTELRMNLGAVFLIFYSLALLLMVISTQIMKYTIRR